MLSSLIIHGFIVHRLVKIKKQINKKSKKEATLTGECPERTRNRWCECLQPRKQQEPGPSPLGSVFKLYLLVVLAQSLTELTVLSNTFRPISKNSPFNTDWQEFQWFTSGSFWKLEVTRSSQVAQIVKNLPCGIRSLGREDPLEKEMAIHSNILAWRIPWTKEPGKLQSAGWQRVRHDWVTNSATTCTVHINFVLIN